MTDDLSWADLKDDLTPEQAYNLGRGLAQKAHTYTTETPPGGQTTALCKCGGTCRDTRESVSELMGKHVEVEAEKMGQAFRREIERRAAQLADK